MVTLVDKFGDVCALREYPRPTDEGVWDRAVARGYTLDGEYLLGWRIWWVIKVVDGDSMLALWKNGHVAKANGRRVISAGPAVCDVSRSGSDGGLLRGMHRVTPARGCSCGFCSVRSLDVLSHSLLKGLAVYGPEVQASRVDRGVRSTVVNRPNLDDLKSELCSVTTEQARNYSRP